MAQNFISFTRQLGTGTTALCDTAAAGFADAVIGIRIANILTNAITINVWVVPTGTANLRYIAKGLSIPPASSVELVQGGAKFVINPGDVLNGNASEGTAADVITSVVDKISTVPV